MSYRGARFTALMMMVCGCVRGCVWVLVHIHLCVQVCVPACMCMCVCVSRMMMGIMKVPLTRKLKGRTLSHTHTSVDAHTHMFTNVL